MVFEPKCCISLGFDWFWLVWGWFLLVLLRFCKVLGTSSSVHFLLQPYLKRMRNAVLAPSILKCSFLITSLFKKDEKCCLGSFHPPVFTSYYAFIEKGWEMLSWLLLSSSVHFLLHPYWKMMRNALLAPSLLQCPFLITSLFKKDEKCSLGSFHPQVFISHYILIEK